MKQVVGIIMIAALWLSTGAQAGWVAQPDVKTPETTDTTTTPWIYRYGPGAPGFQFASSDIVSATAQIYAKSLVRWWNWAEPQYAYTRLSVSDFTLSP